MKGICCEELLAAIGGNYREFDVYPESIAWAKNCLLFMAKADGCKSLYVVGLEKDAELDAWHGELLPEVGEKPVLVAPLNHANAQTLRMWFAFTNPVPFGTTGMSIGLGDRLGLASPGHLQIIRTTNVRPVLAQQSIRELNLTGRTYEEVLDAASWAVFQEGYRLGFGADGDHLKSVDEVKMALNLGFSMITLDCSEQIDNAIPSLTDAMVADRYAQLPEDCRQAWEARYLAQPIAINGVVMECSSVELRRLALTYHKAIAFTTTIYRDVIRCAGRTVDFELSIDETSTPTSPLAHYFVAAELLANGVSVTSLAPRFVGEFQKAIDYIGDLAAFEADFIRHAGIADHFGYRLSIHSGSDKFSVFPIIGKHTRQRVHVKTAGTNWLEALRVICRTDTSLFRAIYRFALDHFDEARQYYHVTTDLSRTVPADVPDERLEEVLGQSDSRQVLHITYGLILGAHDAQGAMRFRTAMVHCWNQHEALYSELLSTHIGRHLSALRENEY